jgi:hypothetical protein
MEQGKISHNKIEKVSQNKSVNMSQHQNSQVQDLSFEDAPDKYKHTEEKVCKDSQQKIFIFY